MSYDNEARNFIWAKGFLSRHGYRYRFQWELYENLLRKNVPCDGVWVDLGCGDNRWLERISARFKVGVDLVTRATLRDRRFINADVVNLPFADGSVDALSARFVLEHLTEPKAFFVEAARVLKQGGSLVVQTTNSASPPIFLISRIPFYVKKPLVRKLCCVSRSDVFPTCYKYNKRGLFEKSISGLEPVELVLHTAVSFSRRWLFLLSYLYERITDVKLFNFLKTSISAVYRKV
jgi:SAM-dependent methyltransferase